MTIRLEVPRAVTPESITATIPAGITFKAAVNTLVEADNSTADFKAGCSNALLQTKVRGGTLRATDTSELIKQLGHRLISPTHILRLHVKKDEKAGIYEIACVP